ncbi:cupin domain-containing protein [Lysinibacillus sp. ZYM-1]|uniref:cupin domain-containing protein n=1 Tax=Lysinibacillus sp. ZYM-1 TaxID=1681184 RepID=UPI0006CE83DC|nr:cupin domain-containing protein [Lysinibacillus sp. ZYM-1]KPN94404.1 cupin [Lysinibacillus sp. ZYM-1]
MKYSAQYFIEHLKLAEHPEGGYYISSFRATDDLAVRDVQRPIYTSIYFLLRSQDISHLHRLQSDELWYFHAGSPLTVHMIFPDGTYEAKKLGLNVEAGEVPQIVVPKHTIFGSSVEEPDTFSLVGCMVAPGFDFEDFELFTQEELLADYPQHQDVIRKMAYQSIK